ncbi:MAG: hypothetical protein AAF561_14650 [Planctomycetota bacterium]
MTEPEPRTLAYTAEPDTARPGWLTIVVWLVAIWHACQVLRFAMTWTTVITEPSPFSLSSRLAEMMKNSAVAVGSVLVCSYCVWLTVRVHRSVRPLGWLCIGFVALWLFTSFITDSRWVRTAPLRSAVFALIFYAGQTVVLLAPAIVFLHVDRKPDPGDGHLVE